MRLWQAFRAKADPIIAALLGVASFALYVKTLAPTLLMADAAEFQLACHVLGIAHPTGYPLYLILGWLWSHLLPLGGVAYRVNLLSAVLSATAVGTAYLLAMRILAAAFKRTPVPPLRGVAAIGTLTLASSRTFWSQALTAEVYALNSVFVVATLYLLLRWDGAEQRSPRTLYLAALVYGLSLTHHRTMILLLPAFILFIWLTDRSALTSLKSLGRMVGLALVPQLLYLYIPMRASATPYLHVDLGPGRQLELYENTLGGFLGFVMGSMFRGELGYQAPVLERLAMAWGFLVKQFGPAGILFGVLGVIRMPIPRRGGETRHAVSLQRAVLLLLALSYLAIVGFCLFYFIGDINVLFTPSYIVFSVFIAVGMAWILEGLLAASERLSTSVRTARSAAAEGRKPSLRTWSLRFRVSILLAFFALLPAYLLTDNYYRVDRSRDHRAREMWEEILAQPIPEGSILVSNDRNEITPLLYLQYVEGRRPDLVSLFPLILPGEEYSNVVRVIDSVLGAGRPIYLIKEMPGLETKYQMEPLTPLVQVLGPAVTRAPEHPTGLSLNDSLALLGYDLDPDEPVPGEELSVTLYWQVKKPLPEDYHSYVHLVDETGQVVSQSDHGPGGDYYPSSLWRPGETLVDRHDLGSAPTASAGRYGVQAGMYSYPSLQPFGPTLMLARGTQDRPGR